MCYARENLLNQTGERRMKQKQQPQQQYTIQENWLQSMRRVSSQINNNTKHMHCMQTNIPIVCMHFCVLINRWPIGHITIFHWH